MEKLINNCEENKLIRTSEINCEKNKFETKINSEENKKKVVKKNKLKKKKRKFDSLVENENDFSKMKRKFFNEDDKLENRKKSKKKRKKMESTKLEGYLETVNLETLKMNQNGESKKRKRKSQDKLDNMCSESVKLAENNLEQIDCLDDNLEKSLENTERRKRRRKSKQKFENLHLENRKLLNNDLESKIIFVDEENKLKNIINREENVLENNMEIKLKKKKNKATNKENKLKNKMAENKLKNKKRIMEKNKEKSKLKYTGIHVDKSNLKDNLDIVSNFDDDLEKNVKNNLESNNFLGDEHEIFFENSHENRNLQDNIQNSQLDNDSDSTTNLTDDHENTEFDDDLFNIEDDSALKTIPHPLPTFRTHNSFLEEDNLSSDCSTSPESSLSSKSKKYSSYSDDASSSKKHRLLSGEEKEAAAYYQHALEQHPSMKFRTNNMGKIVSPVGLCQFKLHNSTRIRKSRNLLALENYFQTPMFRVKTSDASKANYWKGFLGWLQSESASEGITAQVLDQWWEKRILDIIKYFEEFPESGKQGNCVKGRGKFSGAYLPTEKELQVREVTVSRILVKK